jgi:hypothetical protein
MNITACIYHKSNPVVIDTLPGIITRVGYYRDTLPLMLITIPKRLAGSLKYRDGERVTMPLVVDGERYLAGIRTTTHSETLQVCPDLVDSEGKKVRLADIIFKHRLDSSHIVNLNVIDSVLYCTRGSEQQIQQFQKLGWIGFQRKGLERVHEKF